MYMIVRSNVAVQRRRVSAVRCNRLLAGMCQNHIHQSAILLLPRETADQELHFVIFSGGSFQVWSAITLLGP